MLTCLSRAHQTHDLINIDHAHIISYIILCLYPVMIINQILKLLL